MDFLSPYATAATIAVGFEPDEKVRFLQERFEAALSDLALGQSKSTNIPDEAPAELPRLVFERKLRRVEITQALALMTLEFEKEGGTLPSAFPIIEKAARNFFRGIRAVKESKIVDQGITVSINVPAKGSAHEVARFISDRFIKIVPYAEDSIVSALVRIGSLTSEGLFQNFAFDAYDVRNYEATDEEKKKDRIVLSVFSLPIIESGLEVKIDVNDKPKRLGLTDRRDDSMAAILSAIHRMTYQDLPRYLGLEMNP